eukprot:1154773-Pelagomonas_calceolata.AAC.5
MGNIDINDSNPWHDPSVSDEQHNEFYDSKDEGEGAHVDMAVLRQSRRNTLSLPCLDALLAIAGPSGLDKVLTSKFSAIGMAISAAEACRCVDSMMHETVICA